MSHKYSFKFFSGELEFVFEIALNKEYALEIARIIEILQNELDIYKANSPANSFLNAQKNIPISTTVTFIEFLKINLSLYPFGFRPFGEEFGKEDLSILSTTKYLLKKTPEKNFLHLKRSFVIKVLLDWLKETQHYNYQIFWSDFKVTCQNSQITFLLSLQPDKDLIIGSSNRFFSNTKSEVKKLHRLNCFAHNLFMLVLFKESFLKDNFENFSEVETFASKYNVSIVSE